MKSEPFSPRSSGQAVRVCQTLPSVAMEGIQGDQVPGPRSSGQLVRRCQVVPPLETVAVGAEDFFLELTLTLTEEADANRVFGQVVQWVERLHAYERLLGGAGLQWDKDRSAVRRGTVQ